MKVIVPENGPVLVYHDDSGSPVALCRCGKTSNERGLCDGTHARIGFQQQGYEFVETGPV